MTCVWFYIGTHLGFCRISCVANCDYCNVAMSVMSLLMDLIWIVWLNIINHIMVDLDVPWQTVALNWVYPTWHEHLKVPTMFVQLACSSHGLFLSSHSLISSWQSPPVNPAGHSSQPVVTLQTVSLLRQLQSRWQSLPHVPLRHAAMVIRTCIRWP